MGYTITQKTKQGLMISQNRYTKAEAEKRAKELSKLGMNVKVMSVNEALGL